MAMRTWWNLKDRQRIAAILDYDGKVVSLPRPNRHHKCMIAGKQGFVLTDGSFVDRKTAKLHSVWR